MATCSEYRMWMQGADRGDPLTTSLQDHLAQCSECRDLTDTYDLAVESVREAMDEGVGRGPDMARIRAELGCADGPKSERTVPAWAVLSAAAAALAVLGLWWALGGGGVPVDPETPRVVRNETGVPAPVPAEERGYPVLAGQMIETAESGVTISDPRIGSVELSPHARLRVDSWHADQTQLALVSGQVEASVVGRKPGQVFNIRTEFVVIRVVGTRFRVNHTPGTWTTITSLEGSIHVDTFDGYEVASMPPDRIMRVGPSLVIGPRPVGQDLAMVVRPGDEPAKPISRPRSRVAKAQKPVKGTAESSPAKPTLEEVVARARGLLADGRNREAVACLKEFSGGSGQARILALLGDAYQLDGRLEEARKAYESALSAGPSPAPEGVLLDLARLYHDRLASPAKAREAWNRYLDAYPGGRYAGQALYRLASLARAGGDESRSAALLKRVLKEAPGSQEAVRALSQVGRTLFRREGAEAAADWFRQWKDAPARDLSEAALVGLLRVRVRQGDEEAVQALTAEHLRRFPQGKRRSEIDNLTNSL